MSLVKANAQGVPGNPYKMLSLHWLVASGCLVASDCRFSTHHPIEMSNSSSTAVNPVAGNFYSR